MQAGKAQHECRPPSCSMNADRLLPSPQGEALGLVWVLVLHCVGAYLILTCLHHQMLPQEQGPVSCSCTLTPPRHRASHARSPWVLRFPAEGATHREPTSTHAAVSGGARMSETLSHQILHSKAS